MLRQGILTRDPSGARRRRLRHLAGWAGALALVASVVLIARAVDADALAAAGAAALSEPSGLAAITALYALAFVLRAVVWRAVLPGLGFGHALAALHVSLLGNHVLPFRLGEALRVTSVVRRARVSLGDRWLRAALWTRRAAGLDARRQTAVPTCKRRGVGRSSTA